MVLFSHLYRRLMRRGRVISLLALSSVPALFLLLAVLIEEDIDRGIAYSVTIAGPGFTYAIAALILTVATLRDERDGGTLPYIYMRPLSRLTLAGSSIAAGTAAALTIALGAWILTALSGLLIDAGLDITFPGLVLFVAAGIGYAAVFVPLGYLVPRALLVGLGYLIIIESILAPLVTGLAQFSIWRIAMSIYADVAVATGADFADTLGPVEIGAGGGIAKIAAIVLAGLGILTWALRRRDAL